MGVPPSRQRRALANSEDTMWLRPVLTAGMSVLPTVCHHVLRIRDATSRDRKCRIRRRTITGPRNPCATKVGRSLADGWIPHRITTLLGPKLGVSARAHLVLKVVAHMRTHLEARETLIREKAMITTGKGVS